MVRPGSVWTVGVSACVGVSSDLGPCISKVCLLQYVILVTGFEAMLGSRGNFQ